MLTNPKYKGYYCGNISYIEDYKTNKFVDCFIDVESAKLKKIKEYLKNRWGS